MEQQVVRLPSVMCFIAEFPSSCNRTLCSPSNSSEISSVDRYYHGNNNSLCYTCPLVSAYMSRDVSQGRQTCYVLWALILVIGSFGVVTNCLNIIILLGKAPFCGPSLTSLLIPLSIFDTIASGFAVSYGTLTLVILENISRSWLTMKLYHISLVIYLLGRTGSLFMAILISIERYLVVAHPLKMKIYLSVRKTRIVAAITCLLAVLSNVPRYFSVALEENHNANGVSPLPDFPYLFRSTWLGLLFFKKMVWFGRLHFLFDFLLPLPTLLVLNLLLFIKIRQSNLQRSLLSAHQQNEVTSAKMFGVVVTVLLLSHLLPIFFYIFLTFFKLIYRELSFGTTLSVSINAAANFFIYFAYGHAFRTRFVELLSHALRTVTRVVTCNNSIGKIPSVANETSKNVCWANDHFCDREGKTINVTTYNGSSSSNSSSSSSGGDNDSGGEAL